MRRRGLARQSTTKGTRKVPGIIGAFTGSLALVIDPHRFHVLSQTQEVNILRNTL
jgi:hypothetical protein